MILFSNKNGLKIILKLLVIIPLFFFMGILIGKIYINGSYFILLILVLFCILAGKVLAKM